MKKAQLKKRPLAVIVGALSLAMIGGILAYYTSTSSIENKLSTKKYGGEQIIEKFTPKGGWELGENVTKEVAVENTGEADLFVRVKLDEKWVRGNDNFITLNSKDGDGKFNNANFLAGSGQVSAIDGETTGDGSVVTKILDSNKWVYSDVDGYWYYSEILKPAGQAGNKTELFLESLTLDSDTDMGFLEKTNYYTTMENAPANNLFSDDASQGWKVFVGPVPNGTTYSRSVSNIKKDYEGYAGADYSLIITYETYQATREARAEAVDSNGGAWDNTKTPTFN
jgi:alternate signal-mediated exported protein, CPF_0494 family